MTQFYSGILTEEIQRILLKGIAAVPHQGT